MQKIIALVEDDVALRENYIDAFTKQGYKVVAYGTRQDAEAAFSKKLPDLLIIDIGLGDDIDGGFAVCQLARGLSKTLPIIFFTARDNDYDTICGLRMGADDYLTKDISLPHLLARISALFRRADSMQDQQQQDVLIEVGKMVMDVNRMVVSYSDKPIDLTVTEFWMLHAIVKHPGHVKSREQLMDDSKMVVDTTTITSHIKRIRRKFSEIDAEFDSIETVYGMGYRWKLSV
ncbi:MAG: proteobacterial dedicated sortase system response regulator [Pseudomonadota bacterium]